MILVRLLAGILTLGSICALRAAQTNTLAAVNTETRQTNAEPHFSVTQYQLSGITLVPAGVIQAIMTKHMGKNVTAADIDRAIGELRMEYHNRGYDGVSVTALREQLTNGVLKIRVLEGHLAEKIVKSNLESDRTRANQNGQIHPQTNTPPAVNTAIHQSNVEPHFSVKQYQLSGITLVPAGVVQAIMTRYMGKNVTAAEIGSAINELRMEYHNRGYDGVSVTMPQEQIANGILKIRVLEGGLAKNIVKGNPHSSSNEPGALPNLKTNVPLNSKVFQREPDRTSANQNGQIHPQTNTQAVAKAGIRQTNAEPHFSVVKYDLSGSTLIPQKTVEAIMSKHRGTNITFADIGGAVKELQMEYHNRGYDTINVTVPQQRLTNGVFRIRVFEGRLAEILVKGNHYYSSNNVMRALPSLRTNIFLNSKVFQSELDRANEDHDRQIYPVIHPGPEPDTSSLSLVVKDRIPFHAKLEANNQSAPGTPDQRLNSSIVYDNLWQENHSIGFQYSYSEEDFKEGDQWNFYDRPLVANYSGFYRLPLAGPESLAETAASRPAVFGYNEATRKFELPSASESPELNLYASRSTIDSGVVDGDRKRLATEINTLIDEETDHQDLTVNEDLGLRASKPLPVFLGFRSTAQAGMDFKVYRIASYETNDFIFTRFLFDASGKPFTRVSVVPSSTHPSFEDISYLPLTLRWDGTRPDSHGTTAIGFGYSPNLWFSGGRSNVEQVAGSAKSTGYWQILTASVAREQTIYGEWKLALRADGQWASEPLISNEQLGVGGIAGVRGYREGEVFGDDGWRITSEFKTPTQRIGFAGKGTSWPLTVRASVFMDYAQADLLDPQGREGVTPLWGAGIGGAAAIGNTFDAHLGFSWPLLSTPTSEAGQLRVTFSMSAQF